MARMIALDVDVGKIEGLADKLAQFDGDMLIEVSTNAVNEVATRAYDLSKRRMTEGLTLTDVYVSRKVTLRRAELKAAPKATITANGTLTSLGHYSPAILTQPVKNASRSKGNPALGIAPGSKPAGVSVEVRKGNRKQMATAFTLPGKKDNEGNPLVFIRNGTAVNPNTRKPRVKALLGPSVYQLFKFQVTQIIDGVEDDLTTTLAEQAEAALQKVLE